MTITREILTLCERSILIPQTLPDQYPAGKPEALFADLPRDFGKRV